MSGWEKIVCPSRYSHKRTKIVILSDKEIYTFSLEEEEKEEEELSPPLSPSLFPMSQSSSWDHSQQQQQQQNEPTPKQMMHYLA